MNDGNPIKNTIRLVSELGVSVPFLVFYLLCGIGVYRMNGRAGLRKAGQLMFALGMLIGWINGFTSHVITGMLAGIFFFASDFVGLLPEHAKDKSSNTQKPKSK